MFRKVLAYTRLAIERFHRACCRGLCVALYCALYVTMHDHYTAYYGSEVASLLAYSVVWHVARHTSSAHGCMCRLLTGCALGWSVIYCHTPMYVPPLALLLPPAMLWFPKPKKTDDALLNTLEEIHAWTLDNVAELRTRRGSGLRLTLKKDGSAVEKRYLNVLNTHKKRIEDTPELAARLFVIDAMLATEGRHVENLLQTMSEISAWTAENVAELK